MRWIAFDDGRGLLSPLTDLRPVFDVRTGALTTLERLRRSLGSEPAALFVPEALASLARLAHDCPINTLPEAKSVLLVNGRCPLPLAVFDDLPAGRMLVEPENGDVVAAKVDGGRCEQILGGGKPDIPAVILPERVLLSRPWHVRSVRDRALQVDLQLLSGIGELPHSLTVVGAKQVHVHATAVIYQGVVLDAEAGPIVIDEGATVRPNAVICGPAYIGQRSMIVAHALIKPNTAIGPLCKIGGEVGGTIFQGCSNKAHDGHLGDSWVGEWVNLGAGTTNSNLLNTYGQVNAQAEPHGRHEQTGETHLGCIIGDHVKTAIATRMMTGAVIGTGTMWAASRPVSGCVAPFSWVTDEAEHRYRLGKFLDVARVVMARRDVEPSDAYTEVLRSLHSQ